jgi:hypothetical protein
MTFLLKYKKKHEMPRRDGVKYATVYLQGVQNKKDLIEHINRAYDDVVYLTDNVKDTAAIREMLTEGMKFGGRRDRKNVHSQRNKLPLYKSHMDNIREFKEYVEVENPDGDIPVQIVERWNKAFANCHTRQIMPLDVSGVPKGRNDKFDDFF